MCSTNAGEVFARETPKMIPPLPADNGITYRGGGPRANSIIPHRNNACMPYARASVTRSAKRELFVVFV